MRLLEYDGDGGFRLTRDYINNIPPFAILSHTWGPDTDEVTFSDLVDGGGLSKPGYDKLRFCGKQAKCDGLQYFWVDTCCIDKSNSAELTEAINSMFRWYRDAVKCYVYLADVSVPTTQSPSTSSPQSWEPGFRRSRWFTRGWTLQELIAPPTVEFFSREGNKLGDKRSLEKCVHEITRIPIKALQGVPLSDFTVAERMSWTEMRNTTRAEDKAYSLLGIFDISMPLIYGEGGEGALRRLRKEIQHQAEETLPSVHQAISDLSYEPFQSVALTIRPETIPKDPDVLLELRLQIDDQFHGRMSFFISHYREDRTWPASYGLRELEYKDFYMKLQPRLDVQFKWFDKVIQLQPVLRDLVLLERPEMFWTFLDGEEFKPQSGLALPQKLEIPCLHTLIKNRNRFELILHNNSTRAETVVPGDTDISIELKGELKKDWIQLYRSHLTREQRDLLTTPYLSPPGMSPILRNALLARYSHITGLGSRSSYGKTEIIDMSAFDKDEFGSLDELLEAASHEHQYAQLNWVRSRWQDSYKSYQKASDLLWPLIVSKVPLAAPPMTQATALCLSLRRMCEIWQRQKSFANADFISNKLLTVTRHVRTCDPAEPDFQRMWADALLQRAEIAIELGEASNAVDCLVDHVKVHRSLYLKFQSPARRIDWIKSILAAVQIVSKRKLSADKQLKAWKATLKEETGDDRAFDELTRPPRPPELPVWLKACTLKLWPTKPIRNTILRYSLQIPERWSTDFKVRGTSSETEHIYNGGAGSHVAEFLMISVMGDVNEHGDMRPWIDMAMAISGFPVICDSNAKPQMLAGGWQYIGKIPLLASRMNVDEAHGYTGVADFGPGPAMLGRIYVLLIRKGRMAWKIALSFKTACLPGMPEEMLNSNDHNRAGAVFGTLQVGDV